MKKYLKTKGAVIGAVAVVFVLIALLSVLLTAGRVSFVQNSIHAAGRSAETGIRNFIGGLERLYDRMHNYDQLEQEHQTLLDQLAQYQRIAREAADAQEEIRRYRELLGLTEGIHNERYIDAYVLTWDPSNWTSAFTIDAGKDAGIEVGNAVINERREFVGIVRQVGRNWATVQTVIDPGIGVGGQMGTGVTAVAEGDFALMQEGNLRLSHVPSGEAPLLYDMIITSGFGGMIPAGITIGQIIRVGIEGTGISYYAVMEPAADLNRLVQVFVVQWVSAPDPLDSQDSEG